MRHTAGDRQNRKANQGHETDQSKEIFVIIRANRAVYLRIGRKQLMQRECSSGANATGSLRKVINH